MNLNAPLSKTSFWFLSRCYYKYAVAGTLVFLLLQASAFAQDDWARWRGPEGNGIAAKDQSPPTTSTLMLHKQLPPTASQSLLSLVITEKLNCIA